MGEVQQSRNLKNVCIHVERVIGLLRPKYTILSSTIAIEYANNKTNENLAAVVNVVAVYAALTNLSSSVVSYN